MPSALAILGGAPVRKTLLPYSRQSIDADDVRAVQQALQSDWLTTGPAVAAFEQAFAAFTGAKESVVVSNGTAALHAAMHALKLKDGDEVIVPAMTFAATANAAVYERARPVFADCDPRTLCIDPLKAEKAITKKTRAIVSMDYAGQACDYDALRAIADRHHLPLVADACHALGGSLNGKPVGTLADLNTFSFHAVKPLATGEGGMITTHDPAFAQNMRRFRNHGISGDHRERQEKGSWFYEMQELGNNYRLTDFQCALGMSQMKKVPTWTKRRQEIARMYTEAFAKMDTLAPLALRAGVSHSYHLYVVRLNLEKLNADRAEIFRALRAENIGVNVHYIPVHLHPYYRTTFGWKAGDFPETEKAYEEILSLPLFAGMTDADARDVLEAVQKVCTHFRK